jgi:hypothetical protein
VRDAKRLQSGNRISYQQARQTTKAVRDLIEGDGTIQFRYIRPLLAYLEDDYIEDNGDPVVLSPGIKEFMAYSQRFNGAIVKVKQSRVSVFEAAIVFPTANQLAWHLCRQLIMFDGAHLLSPYHGILLLATAIDQDEATIVLAWAIVRSESIDTWCWFFNTIAEPILSSLDKDEDLAIISDRNIVVAKMMWTLLA